MAGADAHPQQSLMPSSTWVSWAIAAAVIIRLYGDGRRGALAWASAEAGA